MRRVLRHLVCCRSAAAGRLLQVLTVFRSPPFLEVAGEAGLEQPAISGLSYLLKGLGKSLPPLDQSCWHECPVVLGFQPLRLSCIHYACPCGTLLKRHLLPLTGVGFRKLPSKHKMAASAEGSPKLQGHAPGCRGNAALGDMSWMPRLASLSLGHPTPNT